MAKRGKLKLRATKQEIERPVRIKKYRYLFLIVCEDESTEPAYFRRFKDQIPADTIYLKEVGTGRDPKGVVEQAVLERDKLATDARKEVDVVWVVFDKDDADMNEARIQRFNDALSIANHEKFKLGFSNEVFELWLLLHLEEVDPNIPLPRARVYERLQEAIRRKDGYAGFDYVHGDAGILNAIADTGDETAAMQRAEALQRVQEGKDLLAANPVTYVHHLVKSLYEWIAYFSFVPE